MTACLTHKALGGPETIKICQRCLYIAKYHVNISGYHYPEESQDYCVNGAAYHLQNRGDRQKKEMLNAQIKVDSSHS